MPVSKLYVVTDLKGSGRIVGVFDDAEYAESIAQVDRAYYRITEHVLNEVSPVALQWLTAQTQREALIELKREHEN